MELEWPEKDARVRVEFAGPRKSKVQVKENL